MINFYFKRLLIVSLGLFTLLLLSCGKSSSSPSVDVVTAPALVPKTKIQGVAMLGAVTEGEVACYHMQADGTPDTSAPLATATTDANGAYTMEIPQENLVPNETLVIQITSGKYIEEGSGQEVTLTKPIGTLLPINDAYSDTGAIVQAAISPLTDICVQRHMQEAGKAMVAKALAEGAIPPEFQDEAKAFQDKAFDPNFLKDNPDFKAAFEAARGTFSKDATFRENIAKIATDSVFAVSQAFGLTNVVGTLPSNPRTGGTDQEGAAYMAQMAAISHKAFQAGTDSVAMMNAMAFNFSRNGNFDIALGAPPFEVFDASGKAVNVTPPKFSELAKAMTDISTGVLKLPNFVMFEPPVGPDGVRLPPPTTGVGIPSWGGTFKPPVFVDKPSFTPPEGWTAGCFTMPPLPPGWVPPTDFKPPPDFKPPEGFVPPPGFVAPTSFVLPPGFVPPPFWAPPPTFVPPPGFAPPPGFKAPEGFVPPTGFQAPIGFEAPPFWAPPPGFVAPAGFHAPEGFVAPVGFAPPVGFIAPTGWVPTAGFIPPPGFIPPEGFVPPEGYVPPPNFIPPEGYIPPPPPGGVLPPPPPGGVLPPPSPGGGFVGPLPNLVFLTTGADLLKGTYGDEFYNGMAIVGSFDSLDSIEGDLGMDVLSATLNANVTPVLVTGIESMMFQANAAATVNLTTANVPLMLLRDADSLANDLTVSNAPFVQTFDMINNSAGAGAFTVTVKNANLTGAADMTNLSLNSVSTATITIGPVTAASGYETINIRSDSPTKNGVTADLVLDDGAGTSLATVNVIGMAALDIDFTPTTITTVGANMMLGALDVQFATANGQNVTVATGSGNDIIDVQGYTAADVINAGTGTDRLVLTSAEAAAGVAQTNVTGVEIIKVSGAAGAGAAYVVPNFSATGLELDGTATAGALTVTLPTGTSSLNLDASTGGGLLTVNIAGAATTDVLNMTMGSSAAGNAFGQAITFGNAELVNLTTQGGAVSATTFTIPAAAGTQQLTVLGTQNLTFSGLVTADVIDASGVTGTAALSIAAGTAAATTITGGLNADTLAGSTAADTIVGGAGADSITNTVTGAAVTAGDTLTGGTGIDTFTLIGSSASAANYAGSPSVTDYVLGTDLIRLSAAATDYSAGLTTGAGAAGSTASAEAIVIQTVAQSAGAAAVGATANVIKLTTAVAAGADAQATFNSAIGTSTVTGCTAATVHLVTLYDSTNSRMVILEVLTTGTVTTTLETADVVRLIGSVAMSSADYTSLAAANLAAFL